MSVNVRGTVLCYQYHIELSPFSHSKAAVPERGDGAQSFSLLELSTQKPCYRKLEQARMQEVGSAHIGQVTTQPGRESTS